MLRNDPHYEYLLKKKKKEENFVTYIFVELSHFKMEGISLMQILKQNSNNVMLNYDSFIMNILFIKPLKHSYFVVGISLMVFLI